MTIDFKALGAAATATGADMTQAQQGGGDYEPPAAGPTRLRFVAYVEVGKHERIFQGTKKTENRVQLVFELSGPKHPPQEINGERVPHRITIEENLSLNDKANFFKLFQRMNYKGSATHMVQLLGESYLGTVVHDKWTAKKGPNAGKERISATLRGDDGYTIRPPRFEDPETGELRVIQVDPPISQLRGFVWNLADKQQWDNLFIDGTYPERKDATGKVIAPAKSKSVFQNKIRQALNFEGSPIAQVLAEQGVGPLDIPDAEDGSEPDPAAPPAAAPAPAQSQADPLAGIA